MLSTRRALLCVAALALTADAADAAELKGRVQTGERGRGECARDAVRERGGPRDPPRHRDDEPPRALRDPLQQARGRRPLRDRPQGRHHPADGDRRRAAADDQRAQHRRLRVRPLPVPRRHRRRRPGDLADQRRRHRPQPRDPEERHPRPARSPPTRTAAPTRSLATFRTLAAITAGCTQGTRRCLRAPPHRRVAAGRPEAADHPRRAPQHRAAPDEPRCPHLPPAQVPRLPPHPQRPAKRVDPLPQALRGALRRPRADGLRLRGQHLGDEQLPAARRGRRRTT